MTSELNKRHSGQGVPPPPPQGGPKPPSLPPGPPPGHRGPQTLNKPPPQGNKQLPGKGMPPMGNPPPGSKPIPRTGPQFIDANDDKQDKKGGVGKNCCKKVLKFAFSHIGLCGMVVAYSIAGGFIFQHLEKTNELQECVKAKEKYDPLENSTMYKLWDISSNFRQNEDVEYALLEFQKLLVKFRDDVLALSYDGKNCTQMDEPNGPGYQWTFSGALLFAITVITTIGYGNIAPKTFWGRLVCIAYATLGIPLMLLCLANIGDVMADIFRFIYTKVCCCGCCRRKDKNRVQSAPGDKDRSGTPEAWKNQYAAQRSGAPPPAKGPMVVDDEDDEDDEEDEKISVPLTITMGVIGGYIFMGALLFGVWEGWDALKASYFCFVTISTIGFGDVVPGSANFESNADQWKMIGAAIYMLFGMAILSMCFSLIQEEIVAKFRWVGEKIGILEKDKGEDGDDDDDDEEDEDKKKKRPDSKKVKEAGMGFHGTEPKGPNHAKQVVGKPQVPATNHSPPRISGHPHPQQGGPSMASPPRHDQYPRKEDTHAMKGPPQAYPQPPKGPSGHNRPPPKM